MSTFLVLGANRGIGLELARLLHERGDKVIATCRQSSPSLDGLGVQTETGVDIASLDSLRQLASRLEGTNIDAVLVVAGILERTSLDDLNPESIKRQFEINALGPLQVAATLRHLIRPGGKFGMLTSRMGSIADNTSGGAYGYRMSKAAVNAAGKSLAHDLAPQKISVVLLHPGYVRTDMTGGNGNLDAQESAAMLIARFDELTSETSGSFVHANGESLPW